MNVYDEHFESVIARIYIGEVETTFDLMYIFKKYFCQLLLRVRIVRTLNRTNPEFQMNVRVLHNISSLFIMSRQMI